MNGLIHKSPSMTSNISYRIEDGLVIEEVINTDEEIVSIAKSASSSKTKTKTKTKTKICCVKSPSGESEDSSTNGQKIEVSIPDDDDVELTIVDMPTPADIQQMNDNGNGNGDIIGKQSAGTEAECKDSLYGKPLPVPKLKEYFGFGDHDSKYDVWEDAGLVWYSTIVPNDFDAKFDKRQSLKMLPKRFYDADNHCIKPRRPTLSVRQNDFFSSLVKIPPKSEINNDDASAGYPDDVSDFKIYDDDETAIDEFGGKIKKPYSRWVFSGVLNGWPGLKHLELVKIEYKSTMIPTWRTQWKNDDNPKDKAPSYPKSTTGLTEVRARLREPGWSAQGWSKDSPGYVFYYTPGEVRKVPRLLYGTNIIKQFEQERYDKANKFGRRRHVEPSPKCVKVHMISHRYAVQSESIKDRLSYHSFALLEWDHGKYCTVIELAFLNGLGGYNARCNHTEDKNAPVTSMLKCFPAEMVKPWKDSLSEIRIVDVKAKNVGEYLEWMKKYTTDDDKRFVDIRLTFSHPVRLTFCSQEHIVHYVINYIRRGRTYSEIRKNCQTFAADLCAFLAGKKDVQPFHPLNRFEYHNQTHYFMYESSMYEPN